MYQIPSGTQSATKPIPRKTASEMIILTTCAPEDFGSIGSKVKAYHFLSPSPYTPMVTRNQETHKRLVHSLSIPSTTTTNSALFQLVIAAFSTETWQILYRRKS